MNLKAVTPLGAALIVTFGCSLALLLENLYLFGYHLDLESAAFLGNYLADRSLPELVFDPARNDWKLYQARELSYFFDCIHRIKCYILLCDFDVVCLFDKVDYFNRAE